MAACPLSAAAIAHEAAGHCKFAKVVYRRHRMARGQGHKLCATSVKETISAHGKRLDVLWGDTFECRLDLAVGARPQNMNLQIERARGLLHVTYLAPRLWEGRIHEKPDRCRLRYQLVQ